ncbi:MAG TPA: chemotaxis protein CheB [Kofleriaceae bacterium]|nr:chemotaxis protein CheB [Kofleriaceae bacterium]
MDLESTTEKTESPEARTDGRIVGIGASAGGLESLEQLFSVVPRDTGLAFVVVQHLSPDFRSLMDELIARRSEIPVVVAEDGMAVQADHIYLMPPRKEMIIRDRHLWLTDKEPHTFSLPIDSFFRSLAQDVGPQAVAIVLSGSGSDGSRGIVDVKRAGGLVLAESPVTAKFDGMPLAAAGTGVVDHTHTPGDLARLLCGLPPLESAEQNEILNEDPVMDAVLRLLRDNYGIDFSLYKMTTVGRRIQRRVELLRLPGLPEYLDQLMVEPEELNHLYQDLLIGVTQFFRDPAAFDAIERDVIPKLVDQLKPDDELRVWTAGCATGEEAYSLAMLFFEAFTVRNRAIRVKILATDVHQRSLDYASAGIYGEDQLGRVGAQRLERFFTKRASGYQVSPELRQLIVFARHNVTKDPPFTKMHLISCRNMLIYLQPQAQRAVLSLFHFGLLAGGTLFLGASETPGSLSDEFAVVDEPSKIYRKRRDVHLLSQVRLPIARTPARPVAVLDLPRATSVDSLLLSTYDQLLELFMPPALLVDESGALIDAYGGAERILKFKPRRPSGNVLELLPPDLRTIVTGATQRARKERRLVSYSGVPIPGDGRELRCVVTVQPLVHPRTRTMNILITWREMPAEDQARSHGDDGEAHASFPAASLERVSSLESELQLTRETLQATIEELETSNEEMQATNEELVASNEELQSTNEELHSVNEELYTVNAEHQQKITELKELNSDMAHLLEGTDVGTVFLDRELRIRRFTSRIANVFRFQPHDIGRRIGDFSHNIDRAQLMQEVEDALRSGQTVEDEVRDHGGTPYFLRILPYRVVQRTNGNGHGNGHGNGTGHANGNGSGNAADAPPIDGVVLTLTEMTALDRARTRVDQLSAIVESSNDAILGVDLHGTITSWNRGAEQRYGYTAEEAIGKHASMLMAPGSEPELDGYLTRIANGERLDALEHASSLCRCRDGTFVDVSVMVSPIHTRTKVVGAAVIARDISQLTQTQRALESEQRKVKTLLQRREEFLAMLSHELRNPLSAIMAAIDVLDQADESPDRSVRCRGAIKRQATHIKRLLDDLLDVSRITSDKLAIDVVDLDAREPIDTAIEATAHLFEERGVQLVANVPPRPLPIRGDTRRICQVVANLLANAATHSEPSSIVTLEVEAVAGRLEIVVRDEGEGIDPELQPKIFDLFVQAEQKLDRPRGGLGVGLSLVKTIVGLHDGTIAVHSDGLGKGSEFRVSLPLGRRAVAQAREPRRERVVSRKVVLVDDQEDSREMLRMLLEARSHVVFDGEDGAAAVRLVEEHVPDIAFIDIGLPVLNGFEVAQRIRQRPELKDVMLIALSGYGDTKDVHAALAAGFDDHVTKPAQFSTLEQILARTRGQVDG